jgi:hypothetical protein|tara:strand:- start:7 stop:567 length:561 start_codon:yes stop_codon:yes gene_type:complete
VEYICTEVLDLACESVHDDALSVNGNDERTVRYRHVFSALVTNPLLQSAVMRRADGSTLPKEEARPTVSVVSAIAAGFAMRKARKAARMSASHGALCALHATVSSAIGYALCAVRNASIAADVAAEHACDTARRSAIDVALAASRHAATVAQQAANLVEAISPDRALKRAIVTPVQVSLFFILSYD